MFGDTVWYSTLQSGDSDAMHQCRKTMFSVTSIFVNLSETMAELGFLVSVGV